MSATYIDNKEVDAGNQVAVTNEKNRKMHNGKVKGIIFQSIFIFFLLVLLFLQYYPLFITLAKSFKDIEQDFLHPYSFTWPLYFENYAEAWTIVKDLLFNTVILAAANVFGTLLVSSMSAFVFARCKFPFKETIFMIILSLIMIPGILTLVAQYDLIVNLGLVQTRWAVILPGIAGNSVFNTFLLRTFFNGVPGEVFEAAEIDGAGRFRQYWSFMIPLSVPIIMTAGIMLLLQSWNDLIWPMMVLSERQYTISTGLIPFTSEYYRMTHSYSIPMAGYIITSLPLIIVFFFTSKQFISGLTSGAFKM